MASVSMNAVQFYNPSFTMPSLSARRATAFQKHRPSTGIPHSKERSRVLESNSLVQHIGADEAGNQDDPASNDFIAADEDDDFPLLKEILHPNFALPAQGINNTSFLDSSRSSMPVQSSHPNGSKERPVVLNDDDDDDDDDEHEVTFDDVNATRAERDATPSSTLPDQEPASELSRATDTSGPGRWYDIEAGCYVKKEPPLSLQPEEHQDATISTPTHSYQHSPHHSPGPSHYQIDQHGNDRNTQCIIEELLDEDGGGESRENTPELDVDKLLAFEEQEVLLSATAPSSPHLHHQSTKPPRPQIDQEHDQSGTDRNRLEEPGHDSPPSQDQKEELPRQQRLEVVVDAMEDAEYDSGEPEQGQRGQKRRCQDRDEGVSSNIHQSEGSDCSYNTNSEDDKDDEDDEEPRPAKRRKLPLKHTHKILTPHGATLPLASQFEVDDTQSQADSEDLSAPLDDIQHSISQVPQSPPSPIESVPIAEYQEWPFQGFLKRTKIGGETTYNLEFRLPHISERLNTPINPEALDICSRREVPAKAGIPQEAAAHSKIYPAAMRPQIKRAPWTPDEDATLLRMRNEGCSWEDIQTALPHRSKGTIQVRYSTKLKK